MGKSDAALILFICSLFFSQLGQASEIKVSESQSQDPLRIAVAANFKPVLEELISRYNPKRPISVSTGSTGALTAQVRHGAPYDILLAADVKRPEYLENLGLTRARRTYAYGRLAFWQPNAKAVSKTNLEELSVAIAIANPRHAPYGNAAEEVILKTGNVRLKRVKGTNVAQAFSFVQTGNVGAGLVALSQLRYNATAKDTYWVIPGDYHQPIEQQAVVMRGADYRADAFLHFLDSTAARKVIRQAGYDLADTYD